MFVRVSDLYIYNFATRKTIIFLLFSTISNLTLINLFIVNGLLAQILTNNFMLRENLSSWNKTQIAHVPFHCNQLRIEN